MVISVSVSSTVCLCAKPSDTVTEAVAVASTVCLCAKPIAYVGLPGQCKIDTPHSTGTAPVLTDPVYGYITLTGGSGYVWTATAPDGGVWTFNSAFNDCGPPGSLDAILYFTPPAHGAWQGTLVYASSDHKTGLWYFTTVNAGRMQGKVAQVYQP